jgi:hypothetical protein
LCGVLFASVRRAFEEELDWHLQYFGRSVQAARADPVRALFIFLHLLERNAEHVAELCLDMPSIRRRTRTRLPKYWSVGCAPSLGIAFLSSPAAFLRNLHYLAGWGNGGTCRPTGRDVTGSYRGSRILEGEARPQRWVGPVTPGADAAVKMLNDRLIAARAAETRRTESQRRLTKIIRAREDADVDLDKAEGALQAVAEKLPTDADLIDVLDRLTERNLQPGRSAGSGALRGDQVRHRDEDKLRAELTDFNSDGVGAVLAMLENEEQELEREMQEIFAARSEALRQRAEAEQGMGAEVAAQQRSSAEAELVAASREWLVLKFGALLITTAIDRRRADESDPLLTRAGSLFAMLTGNSFSRIDQEYDEHMYLALSDADRQVKRCRCPE